MKFFDKFRMSLRSSILVAMAAFIAYPQACNAQFDVSPQTLFADTPDFLKVEDAFKMDFEQQGNELIVKWDIAPSYYLYKKQFKVEADGAVLEQGRFPPSVQVEDEYFGISDVYKTDMQMSFPITFADAGASVELSYQGCAEAGLCYPIKTISIPLNEVKKVETREDLDLRSLFSEQPTFLKVEEAFGMEHSQSDGKLTVNWTIADGYYLYKKQFKTVVKNADLGDAIYPESTPIEDEFFGKSDVFFEDMKVEYPINSAEQDSVVKIRFQGCATAGLCYPPTTKIIYLNAYPNATGSSAGELEASVSDSEAPQSEQFQLADKLLSNESLLITLGLFVLLGLGLAFTPCVFPMYPILSSIIVGAGKNKLTTGRAFFLSFVYVQGMAITYSLLGLVVASAGVQFQAALQSPIVLVVFIVLFVALAIAMFGGYEIQLPSKWQEKLNGVSNSQKAGNPIGVFIMGVISGLVASPCTTAPLTAILLVIAQSGDLLLGFSALYALSIGMGIPLILFGMTGGKLLPKAGQWMNVVKTSFGFMMLSVAILFVERFIIADWTMLLWVALGLALFSYWFVVNLDSTTSFLKGVRTLVILVGLVVSIILGLSSTANMGWHSLSLSNSGKIQQTQVQVQNLESQINELKAILTDIAVNGNADSSELKAKLDKLEASTGSVKLNAKGHPEFMVVKNLEDLFGKVGAASAQGKSVMVDLYADWCVACKEFEARTFPDPKVIKALESTVWMQIDLTDNTPEGLEFQEYFDITGLPTILFFDKNGYELSKARVTGFMKADPFAEHVERALAQE
ncbi:protein-disulfide reductase DsbD [Glaciecola sp. MH2013]|uniref:protein-disulfide reductase DsbD n=1 Tax=Glaciecola sp. MH2013 TaxID=2785524 RepID=UPI00189DF738|nr:protein-disulfide reductase DsbD [Glaciecola sp. MH2013]MBF7074319.1 protein-disulfide reductase DsbD [Glaciecola sp. MH2013]